MVNVLGLPKAIKFYRKYLLSKEGRSHFFNEIQTALGKTTEDGVPYIPENYRTETVQMDDTFLKSADAKVERRIRKRVINIIYSGVEYFK